MRFASSIPAGWGQRAFRLTCSLIEWYPMAYHSRTWNSITASKLSDTFGLFPPLNFWPLSGIAWVRLYPFIYSMYRSQSDWLSKLIATLAILHSICGQQANQGAQNRLCSPHNSALQQRGMAREFRKETDRGRYPTTFLCLISKTSPDSSKKNYIIRLTNAHIAGRKQLP